MTDVILFFDLVSMVPETIQYQFDLIKHIPNTISLHPLTLQNYVV